MLAALVSLILVAVFYWWFEPAGWLLGVYAIVGTLATLSVPLVYRMTGYTLADEVQWLENREAEEHDEMTQRLRFVRAELETLGDDTGVRQSDKLVAILDDYHRVVETRFLGKKHSPLAYLTTARQVQKLALQNLNDAVAIGHSIASLSRHGLDSAADGKADQASEREIKIQGQMTDQRQRLNRLHMENRQLFDALTDTAVEVANIESVSEFHRLDTMARLVSLAEIASKTGS